MSQTARAATSCIWTSEFPALRIGDLPKHPPTYRTGAATSRAGSGNSNTQRSMLATHRSKVNRSGGQGIASEELMRVQAVVDERMAMVEDEQWLAQQQRMMRPGPFHVYSDDEDEYSDDHDEPATGGALPAGMTKLPLSKLNKSKKKGEKVATKPELAQPPAPEEELPVITFRTGQEERLLDHGYSLGGADDVLDLSSDGGEKLSLKGPSCVTALPDGELIIADTQHNRLVILTPEGQPRAFLHGGEGKEALRQPRGVACDHTALYVSEVGGSRVRKLRLPEQFRVAGAATPRGSHLGGLALNSESGIEGQLTFPQGVALSRGELYVADCEDHRIAVYDAHSLTYLRSFGTYGEGLGQLSYPYSCSVVGEEVIVADVGNHRLSIFTRAGGFLRVIGRHGVGPGEFSSPRSVAALIYRAHGRSRLQRGGCVLGDASCAADATVESDRTPLSPEAALKLKQLDRERAEMLSEGEEVTSPTGEAPAAEGGTAEGGASGGELPAAPPLPAPAPDEPDVLTSKLQARSPEGSWQTAGARDDGKEVLLVVCEKSRVQLLTLGGEAVQIVDVDGAEDLWGVAIAGKYVYVTDKGKHCLHVLTPPRRAATADGARARYQVLSPRKQARAAALGALDKMMDDVEDEDAANDTPRDAGCAAKLRSPERVRPSIGTRSGEMRLSSTSSPKRSGGATHRLSSRPTPKVAVRLGGKPVSPDSTDVGEAILRPSNVPRLGDTLSGGLTSLSPAAAKGVAGGAIVGADGKKTFRVSPGKVVTECVTDAEEGPSLTERIDRHSDRSVEGPGRMSYRGRSGRPGSAGRAGSDSGSSSKEPSPKMGEPTMARVPDAAHSPVVVGLPPAPANPLASAPGAAAAPGSYMSRVAALAAAEGKAKELTPRSATAVLDAATGKSPAKSSGVLGSARGSLSARGSPSALLEAVGRLRSRKSKETPREAAAPAANNVAGAPADLSKVASARALFESAARATSPEASRCLSPSRRASDPAMRV